MKCSSPYDAYQALYPRLINRAECEPGSVGFGAPRCPFLSAVTYFVASFLGRIRVISALRIRNLAMTERYYSKIQWGGTNDLFSLIL